MRWRVVDYMCKLHFIYYYYYYYYCFIIIIIIIIIINIIISASIIITIIIIIVLLAVSLQLFLSCHLTLFLLIFCFCVPGKCQRVFDFLVFPGVMEWGFWSCLGQSMMISFGWSCWLCPLGIRRACGSQP